MAKMKQSLMVDGKKLSNKDPNLVIVLESNPNVFIKEIGEDTITYGFNGFPDEDATYSLNLTFTYMGLISYEVPLNIVQRALAEEPTIVEVKPIEVEAGSAYQAPFRVILPVSGRDLTSGFAIDSIVDNAGTHTSYLAKTNNMMFTAITADSDDVVSTFKFTVSGTHAGKPYTLTADVPVTIKKWTKADYEARIHGGNDTPVISSVNQSGEFTYSLYKRNILVNPSEYVTDTALLNQPGNGVSGATDVVVGDDARKVSMTFTDISNSRKNVVVRDTQGELLTQFGVLCLVDTGTGLSIQFPNTYERLLSGNAGDTILVSPVITYKGAAIPNGNANLTLTVSVSASDPSTPPNITIVGKSGNSWTVRLNGPIAKDVGFLWKATYAVDDNPSIGIAGGVTVFALTPSSIPMELLDPITPNVAQSLRLKLSQPTYGEGPLWTVNGAKSDGLVGRLYDVATDAKIGEDITFGGHTANQQGVVQIDLPVMPYKKFRFEIVGMVSPKQGKNGEGTGYASVPGTFTPVIVEASPFVATPTDNKINYFNNSVTKVIFKLTQEQGAVTTPINAIEITELTVTGKGFTTDTSPVKETEDGTYSFNAKGMGELGDVSVSMKVQYPIGETQVVEFKLRASKIVPVITDNPITVAMWQMGDVPPFTVTLAGTDVTSQITELKVTANDYVKPDTSPAVNKKAWAVLYADTAPKSTQVTFNFKLVVDGVNTDYSGTGTFNLPAWDGVAFKMSPHANSVDRWEKLRLKVGQNSMLNVVITDRGKDATSDTLSPPDPSNSNGADGGVLYEVMPYGLSEGRRINIVGKTVGTHHPSIAVKAANNWGYPANTKHLNWDAWLPEVEVWDDVLAVTPESQDVTGVETKDVNIPIQLTWNGAELKPATTGITYTFAPADILERKGFLTDTDVTCKIIKEVLQETSYPVKMTVTYGGKSDTMDINVTVQPNLIKDLVYTDKPISTSIWQSGDELPFTITNAAGEDASDKLKKVEMVPNTYITADTEGGKLWYVETAETTARDVKTTFNLTFEVDGKEFTSQVTATFKLAAWNGVTLEIIKPTEVIGASIAQDTTFIVYPIYKGKPAADKVELSDLGGTLGGYTTLVKQEASEDNKTLTITLRARATHASPNKQATPLTLTGVKYKVKGTPGTVEGKDVVTRSSDLGFINGDYLSMYNVGWCFTGRQNEVTYMRSGSRTGPAAIVYAILNGVRIPLEDTKLTMYSIFGQATGNTNGNIAWEWVGGTGTTVWGRITRPTLGGTEGYFNPIRAYYSTPEGSKDWTPSPPPATDSNFWVYATSGNLGIAVTSETVTATPATQNELKFKLRVGSTALTTPVVYNPKLIPAPSNGNAMIASEGYSVINDPDDADGLILKFTAGHTGDTLNLKGAVTSPNSGGRVSLDTTIVVPKSPVTPTLDAPSYTADENHQVTVKFKLDQKRYGVEAPYTFPNGTLSGITVTGGSNAGLLALDENGYYGIILDLVTSGNAVITGTITDEGNWKYPFTVTAPVVREYNLTVTDAPVGVKVWDFGTTPPFKVMEGTTDLTSRVTNLKVVPNDHVVQKDAGWLITSSTEIPATSVLTDFTYQLTGDSVVRNASGTFNIAEYDGAEFILKLMNPGTPRGDVTVAAGGTARINVSGWYRGEKISSNPGFTVKEILVAGNIKSIEGVNFMGDTKLYDCPIQPGNSVAIPNIISFTRTGATGSVEGVDYAVLTIPITTFTANTTNVNQTETAITGVFGDEIEIHADMRYGSSPLTLDNSTTNNNGVVSVTVKDNAAIEMVPNSLTPTSFKVRFKGEVFDETVVQTSIDYSMKIGTNAAQVVNRPLTVTQQSTSVALVLSEGFQTSGEGDKDHPLTLTQSSVLPS
ncbi:hypothetical protein OBP_206 [Pseudomonas phage OBP]|uniref:hypothetical protein n=1 Tax=Pseudomonas phage OBP TaxID=1124849 RepID=UPI000240D5B3|nr:hypothetical protein OBP_206 [Pseudomonas phage OBP]AEV89643.1 hypothetical protein OBP_206 [Pseudomonas phage OBP]